METEPSAQPAATPHAEPAAAPSRGTRRAKLIIGLLLIPAGLVVIALGWTELHRGIKQRDADTHVQAKVLGTRISGGTKGSTGGPQVQFRFTVRGKHYSSTDATRRRNLWASVHRDAWDEAADTKRIDVVYAKDDPWINAPAASDKPSLLDAGGGVILGLIALGGGMSLLRSWRAAGPSGGSSVAVR